MATIENVKVYCKSCNGTGIYCGFAEKQGVGVVCQTCGGTGCQDLTYTPFEGRRIRKGIEVVGYSQGRVLDVHWALKTGAIPYAEFIAGSLPTKDDPISKERAK